jgi:hypothetical protein
MKSKLQRLAALASLTTANAMAAVPEAVTAAITDGTADGKTLAFALLAFAVAIGVIMYIKRKAG